MNSIYESAHGVGQATHDTLIGSAAAVGGASSVSERGHAIYDTHTRYASPLAETIAQIRAAHRERCFWMEQRKRSYLALGAYLRTALGWSLNKPPAERKAIEAEALALIDAGEKYVKARKKYKAKEKEGSNSAQLPSIPDNLKRFAHIVVPNVEMISTLIGLETLQEKKMKFLAEQLPVSGWMEAIPGCGLLGLAIIVGEAGDLGNYSNPAKLWKRMGVAVIDGIRQGAIPPGTSRDQRAAAWVERMYSPVRRSRLYTIGVAMAMNKDCPYRQVYLDRKAYEAAKAEADGLIVAPAAKIPKKKASGYRSLGHIDNRARRYMEKRLLRDLWNAWRRESRMEIEREAA